MRDLEIKVRALGYHLEEGELSSASAAKEIIAHFQSDLVKANERIAELEKQFEIQITNDFVTITDQAKRINELEKYNLDLANESYNKSLAIDKANEREKDFIAYLHDAQKWFDKHDPNGHLQSSHPKAVKALNKFAIEQKIEALESLSLNPNNESEERIVAVIDERIEQLRKEQGSE
jgi:hypothetical protein